MKKQHKQEIHRCYPEDLDLTKEEIIKAFGLENYFKDLTYFDKFSSLGIEKSNEYEGDNSILCYGYRDETDQETTDRENREALWQKQREENFHCEPDKPIRMGLYDSKRGCVRGGSNITMTNEVPKTITIPELYFQPEYFSVEKNLLRNIKDSLESGLDHTRHTLIEHDSSLGRTTRKNKSWAETLEKDIRGLENCIKEVDKILVVGEAHYP